MKAELSGRYSLSPAMTVVALTAPGRNCRDIAEINMALNFNVTTVGGNSRNPGNGPSGTTPKYAERSFRHSAQMTEGMMKKKNKQYSHQITNPDTSRYSSTYTTTKTSSTTTTTTTAFSTTTNRTEDANEFAQSPENPVDLSGDVPMMYSPVIQTFSIFDQNDVMNSFTNLSVPEERQSQTQFLS